MLFNVLQYRHYALNGDTLCLTTSSSIHNVQKPLVLSACLLLDEAKTIYEAILENGPLDTVRLRRETRLSAESAKSRFGRALMELQVGLKLLPIGVARTSAWDQAQRGTAGAGA